MVGSIESWYEGVDKEDWCIRGMDQKREERRRCSLLGIRPALIYKCNLRSLLTKDLVFACVFFFELASGSIIIIPRTVRCHHIYSGGSI